jgi:hypothetical protein
VGTVRRPGCVRVVGLHRPRRTHVR